MNISVFDCVQCKETVKFAKGYVCLKLYEKYNNLDSEFPIPISKFFHPNCFTEIAGQENMQDDIKNLTNCLYCKKEIITSVHKLIKIRFWDSNRIETVNAIQGYNLHESCFLERSGIEITIFTTFIRSVL